MQFAILFFKKGVLWNLLYYNFALKKFCYYFEFFKQETLSNVRIYIYILILTNSCKNVKEPSIYQALQKIF